ncbi:hypothetical protein, partial [Stenotrophomonas maltophilia]|uniref:hypothetical protein n=1 Tax=Stenotrophomonas maltophilia TaxID=40324 RepID=UPI00313ED340
LHERTATQDLRQPRQLQLACAVAAAATDDADPAAPVLGRELPADSLLGVNRPAEEPGPALETACDDEPAT